MGNLTDPTYFTERAAVEMNALNRYIMRAFQVNAGKERDGLLQLVNNHIGNLQSLMKKASQVGSPTVLETENKKAKKLKPKEPTFNQDELPDLGDDD